MYPAAYDRLKGTYERLMGSECHSCGAELFPPSKVCRKCGSTDVAGKEMPKEGELVEYTVLRVTSSEFAGQAPIVLGLVQLTNGVRLLGQVTDSSPDSVREGMKVRMVLRVLNEVGKVPHFGYKFAPIQ